MESLDVGPFRDYITPVPGRESYLAVKDGKIIKTTNRNEQAKLEEISSVVEQILPDINKLQKPDIEVILRAYSILKQKEERTLDPGAPEAVKAIFDKAQSHLQKMQNTIRKQEKEQNTLKEQHLAKGSKFLSNTAAKEKLTEKDISELIDLLKNGRQRIQKLKEMRVGSGDIEEHYRTLLLLITTKGKEAFRSILNNFWNEANQEIDRQLALEEVDDQDLALLLNIKAQAADYLDLLDSIDTILNLSTGVVRDNLNNLQNKLNPLLKDVKNNLKTSEHRFSAMAAKEQSIAATQATRALESLEKSKEALEPTSADVGVQPIYLLPEEGVVFKKPSARAREEDNLIHGAMNIKSQEALVPMKVSKRPKPYQYGFTSSQRADLERGYVMNEIDKALQAKIVAQLSPGDLRVWNAQYSKFSFSAPVLPQASYSIKLNADEDWQIISFQKLQSLYFQEKIEGNTLIKTIDADDAQAKSMEEWLIEKPNFFKKIGLPLKMEDKILFPHFVPNLADPANRSAFEKCEQFKWFYLDRATGNEKTFTFKQLHELVLKNQIDLRNVAPVERTKGDGSVIDPPTLDELNKALKVPWKLITPELITKKGQLLGSIQAKPFIKDMILMKKAKEQTYFNKMMEHLTPDAEFNAVLTGELQFLDMHANNLGISPIPNAEYDKFKNVTFRLGRNPNDHTFFQLIKLFLSDKINDDTIIIYQDRGVEISQPLRNLDELKRALNISFKFSIFDTDLSMGEDNELEQISSSGVLGHHIPLRSCLLGTPFQNRPLSKECIERLMQSEESDLRLQEWLQRSDAPILKRLPQEIRLELQEKLLPIQEVFTLSITRKFKAGNLEEINAIFSEEIVQIDKYQEIWQLLEMRTILPGDTLEIVAKRNHTTVEKLTRLNPSLTDPPTTGDRIRVTDELSSDTPEALEKRKQIAPQLFPRATIRQQNALKERQTRRTTYLNNYNALNKEFNNFDELRVQLENFLKAGAVTPLHSLRIEEFAKTIQDIRAEALPLKDKLDLLNELRRMMLEEIQPTYFNLMKVMYPLLADSYELDRLAYNSDEMAGANVGYFGRSLEQAIEFSNRLPRDPKRDKLALILANKITAKINPSFHDYF